MERYMDWKTQYCSDINSPQTDLWGQCNLYQYANGIFHMTRINNSKFYLEPGKNNNQKILRKKKKVQGRTLPNFKTHSLYSQGNQQGGTGIRLNQ